MPLKKQRSKVRLSGPIRVLVIESRGEYCRTVWLAIGIGISHLLIGAINMTIFYYSFKTDDIHAAFGCCAFHLFSAEAILSLNFANGWSAPLRLKHRRYAHTALQICAAIFGIITFLAVVDGEKPIKFHGLMGIITASFAFVSVVMGLATLFSKNKYVKVVHLGVGIPTFLLSSVTIVSGLMHPLFGIWADATISCILIGFVVFYTIFILTGSFLKLLQELRL